MNTYDAIIIGSGNGGLSAALTLAQAGKKVCVFEKHNIPGGCGTSLRRGRFEFEVALHQLSSMGTEQNPGPLRKLFAEYGILDKIEWIPIDSLFSINLPGGKRVPIPADRKKAEQALMDAIVKTGSEVKLNCGINKIIVENGKAIGAIDQNGEEYRAKVVVSNVSPTVTYNNLIDEDKVPKEVIPYFKNYDVGISALTCFIALDCPPEEVGFKDSFNLTYSSLNANRDFKNAYCLDTTIDPIVSTCYTVDDKDGYPAGTSVLTAGTLKFSDAWEKLSPEEYYDAKYAAANTIVDRLEELYPNLRDHIEEIEIEIATPITHMRYLHHPGGAIYGYEQNLKSSVFFFPQEMFIDNLYFASGWVNTCGFGPNYMYGNKIANRILKEMK